MSIDESQYEPDLIIVDEAHRLRTPLEVTDTPLAPWHARDIGRIPGPTRRERRAARAKFRWLSPSFLPDETVRDFRIREFGLYVAARRAWKLSRRRATWGGNAWRSLVQ